MRRRTDTSPRRAAARRGDGVPALPPAMSLLEPVPPGPAENGRRVLDFGGPAWRLAFILAAAALAVALAAPAAGAAYLYAEGEPVAPYLETMRDWLVNVVVGLASLLLAAIARRQGTTQRSQKTISDNQWATAARVDVIAAHVHSQDERLNDAAKQLAGVREALGALTAGHVDGEAAGKVDAAVKRLEDLLDFAGRTGPLAVVTPAVLEQASTRPPAAQTPAPAPAVPAVVTASRTVVTTAAPPPPAMPPAAAPTPAPAGPARQAENTDTGSALWGPAGRPAWARTGQSPVAAESREDALAALLGRPRPLAARAQTWTGILRDVDALQARDDPRHPDSPAG